MNRMQLRDDILTVFNQAEIEALCHRLGIKYQSLRGQNRQDKAGTLIGYLERHGRLPELVQELVRERPHLEEQYAAYLNAEQQMKDERLSWLERLASGEGPAIEEPPTMRWDSDLHPDED
jgi:hypothetical protein